VQARGIDRNTLDGLFMAWNFYSGMPLQQTRYIAPFVASYKLPIRQGWKFYSSPKLWKMSPAPMREFTKIQEKVERAINGIKKRRN